MRYPLRHEGYADERFARGNDCLLICVSPLKDSKQAGLLRSYTVGDWSSGMIPASGAGGREFDSRITPFFKLP